MTCGASNKLPVNPRLIPYPLVPALGIALIICLFAAIPGSTGAPRPFVVEAPPNAKLPDYGTGNQIAMALRAEPAEKFEFDRAALRDVLRFIADKAGIPFIGIRESDPVNRRLITFTMEASPFVALESVCQENGINLKYENGVWFMRTVDEARERRIQEEEGNKLIGVAYKLIHDPVERVDFTASGRGGGGGGGGGSSSSSSSTPNLPLQNSQRVFQAKAPRIVNEIRTMLGLPPITYNTDGTIQGESAQAGTTVQSTSMPSSGEQRANSPERLTPTYVPPQVPQVIYNSDNNTLWVVATKSQHKWVADYLIAVDKPQALIAIEVKFFETKKNPSKQLGVDWSSTMSSGFTLKADNIHFNPEGNITYSSNGGENVNNSWSANGTSSRAGEPLSSGYAIYDSVVYSGSKTGANTSSKTSNLTATAPYGAVLTASQVAVTLRAFMDDRQTTMVQYPRVLTVNNREVAITSAENTPINAGVSSVATGTSSSTPIGTLGYLPIGTQINILPKAVGNDQIALTVAITVSSILGTVPIDLGTGSNDYPVTSQRIYNASLQVNSGYTLAVGGLEKVDDSGANNGVPFLRDIPGVGNFFKSKTRSRNKVNLIVFITPTIIRNTKATTGISETPESVIPVRPDDPVPPTFSPDGRIVGGLPAIKSAFAWLEFQLRYFRQINKENRTTRETIKKLRAVIGTARILCKEIAAYQDSNSATSTDLDTCEQESTRLLTELNQTLSIAQKNLM